MNKGVQAEGLKTCDSEELSDETALNGL
jgi:hypothetical protein